jgi:hypothetical protein
LQYLQIVWILCFYPYILAYYKIEIGFWFLQSKEIDVCLLSEYDSGLRFAVIEKLVGVDDEFFVLFDRGDAKTTWRSMYL